MQKVSSAYTKDTDPVDFIKNSLVVCADKKEPLSCFGQQASLHLSNCNLVVTQVAQHMLVKMSTLTVKNFPKFSRKSMNFTPIEIPKVENCRKDSRNTSKTLLFVTMTETLRLCIVETQVSLLYLIERKQVMPTFTAEVFISQIVKLMQHNMGM